MTCETCGEKPKKCGNCNKDFPRAVIEINNPEKIVLFRKVVVPASMGGRDALPPAIGKYHNVLLEYEADGSLFLYSSDGIPTQLSTDVTDLQKQLDALGIEVDNERVERVAADEELSDTIEEEITNRKDADTALGSQITNLDNSLATVAKTGSYNDLSNKPTIGNATLTIKKNGSNVGTFTANATANKNIDISVPTKTSNLVNDGSDGASQYVESGDLATVATSGSYNDLTNKPTIGNATLTIKRNNTSAGTFTANATTNKSINIAVPSKTSDLTNDGSDGTSTYVESDDLPTVDTAYSSSSNSAIANSTVTNSLDRNVMTDLTLGSTPSTTTVNLNNTKTNLAYPSSATTSLISLPVASSTQAGVMNSATFDAVTSNTNNINAILNGAVAISNLPASPTQAQLTTAWENETGLTSLINRASVYDVTNNKVWTYYTNDQAWHAASNTSQVTVNTFTNSSEGTIKGSTNDGQIFAENDGTGSVNGWDALTSEVSSNTSKLATIAQGAEVNVQANWTQTNTNADDYIRNKPANLVQDANYVHTDNNFTTILKNKLDGIESGAEVNVQADWAQSDTSADDYIKNKPTIPTVNNATLTIQKNGSNIQTFTANSSTNKTANITVPTAVSELTNDANYATTVQLSDGLATKQNTLAAGSNITIANDTISATDTTYTAGDAISIENGVISADVHPADFFDADEYVSDCGSTVNLSETVDSTIKSIELHGDTFQQTYSGKNLCALGTKTVNTYELFPLVKSLPAGTYIFSAQVTGTDTQSPVCFVRFMNGSSGVGSGRISRSDERTFITVTISDVANGLYLYAGHDASSSSGNTATYTNIQIEAGQTMTDYEPYVGGTPAPNPDYPQSINVATGSQTVMISGKNMLDSLNGFANAYIDSGGVQRYGDGANALFGYIQVKPSTAYTLSASTTTRMSFIYYDSSKTFISRDANILGDSATATTPATCEYVRIVIYRSVANGGVTQAYLEQLCLQFELGSQPTLYQPYASPQSFTVDLGALELCKIGTYQDYIYKSGDDWYVHKEIGRQIFTGQEDWQYSSTSGGPFRIAISNAKYYTSDNVAPLVYCDYYTPAVWNSITSYNYAVTAFNNTTLPFRNTDITSLDAWKAWLGSHNTTVYYPFATPTDTKITDATLVGQLDALGAMRSYNGQTNIVVTATSDNLPATLCVTTYRKSLDGVLDLINDTACTCKNRQGNLVIHLPNGMTTYTNNDAPIPIPEVVEAFKRGQSVFLVDDVLPENIYVVTAANMDDGIYSMRADQTGINKNIHDGYWHITGGGDVWDAIWNSVTFVHDATPYNYTLSTSGSTWSAFTSSTPLLDQYRRTYYPASSDVTFYNTQGSIGVTDLWNKLFSWDETPVILRIPLQEISTLTTSLVDTGFVADSPHLTIDVSLGPDNYFERRTSEYKITGWASECTPITFDGKEAYTVGVVRVVENGNTTYSFVVSLTEVEDPID